MTSQKETDQMAQKLSRFVKEDSWTADLILSPQERPRHYFLHQTTLPTCSEDFFSDNEDAGIDYDYVSNIYLMDYQIKHLQESFGEKRPFALDFNIPPLYGRNDILYSKEGSFLYRISLDKKNPCFQKINLKTNEISPLSLPKTLEIAKRWTVDDKDVQEKLCSELTNLFRKTPKEKRLSPQKHKTLPPFRDVYRFYGLKGCIDQKAKQLVLLNTYFSIPPTLCAGKRVMMKKNDIYYKIEFGKKMKFERISPAGHSLMTPQDMILMLAEMNKTKTFGDKTPVFNQLLRYIYNQSVAKELDTSRTSSIVAPPSENKSVITTFIKNKKSTIK